jgi:iron complex outermembrane receptor protein
VAVLLVSHGWAEDSSAPPPVVVPPAAKQDAAPFKGLSLEELMNVEVTSVSRHAERLQRSASAIQVVSGDDIHWSGATSIPEALRLAPNLQVAQVNANEWAISARGFNNVLANKLLVMIDGRTVYTPLFAGVYWDAQDVLLEDLDRIEVVSGPGGAIWGANAVNGVINILSKGAEDTQGGYASLGLGTFLRDAGAVRYGERLGADLYYRVYAKHFDRGSTLELDGSEAGDEWHMTQGGFRLDWLPEATRVTLQGDYYDGRPDPVGGSPADTRGGNVLGRWSRTLSPESDLRLQAYYDHTWRERNDGFTDLLHTYDIDGQHRFPLGSAQEVTWGLGFRLMDDRITNLPGFGFNPERKVLHLYSAFVQDEIDLVADRLRLTLGSKFEHNDYTGFEAQPSGRVAWTPNDEHTVWAAVSRAVRSPSRIDRDFESSIPGVITILAGSQDFESEEVLSYEAGWRLQPNQRAWLSLSIFYNDYDNIRSAEPGPGFFPIILANGVAGEAYGLEAAFGAGLTDWWHLRGGYTALKKHLHLKPGSADVNQATAESNDPEHQVLAQSTMDLPGHVALGVVCRYVSALPEPRVDNYIEMDVRIGWQPVESLELAIVGQNLLDHRHPEFVPDSPSPREIERSVYGSLAFRW